MHNGRESAKQFHLEELFKMESGADTLPLNHGPTTLRLKPEDAVAQYIAIGRSGIPITQAHFLEEITTPKHRILGVATRTLVDFMEEDIAKTATKIHETYVPYGKEDEGVGETLKLAFEWIRQNDPDEFGFLEYEKGKKSYPPYVLAHFQTTFFYSYLHFSKSHTDPRLNSLPVTFEPGTEDWGHDIRNLTIEKFDKLRKTPLRWGKVIDLTTQSTSLNLQRITEMYWSQGVYPESKVFGADALTYELLKAYWLTLTRRAESLYEYQTGERI